MGLEVERQERKKNQGGVTLVKIKDVRNSF